MSDQKNRRILLVDDNPAIHADFGKILAGESGGDSEVDALLEEFLGAEETASGPSLEALELDYELTSAHQGEEALELVRKAQAEGRPFAMAFVDVRMPPGWDGIRTLAELWKVDPALQAVVCTAYSDYSYAEMLRKLGQSDRLLILKKPFDPIEVQQLAGALVEKWNLSRAHESALEEVRSYAASLETVNLALTSDKAMAEAFSQNKVDFIVDAGRTLERPASRLLQGLQSAAELTGAREELNNLTPDAVGMLELIGQVTELAELEAGRFEGQRDTCDLRALVAEVETACRLAAQRMDKRIVIEIDDELPASLHIDGPQTSNLVRHLLLGGLEIAEGDTVRLVAQLESTGGFGTPWMRFEVRLADQRLNPDQKRSVFEPFANSSERLHLPLARQLARFMKADLSIDDDDEGGSRLVLRLDPGVTRQQDRPAA